MHFNKIYFALMVVLFITEAFIAAFAHDSFVRSFLGDYLVVILIYCFVRSIVKLHAMPAAIGVLLFAYVVEVSQYYHLIYLLGLEHYTAAKLILGTSFSWADMLMYTLGMITVVTTELLTAHKHQAVK